jgi:hypothetical protein
MSGNRWHKSEWQRVQHMLASGQELVHIAAMVNKTQQQLRDKIRWERMTAATREARAGRLRYLSVERKMKMAEERRSVRHETVTTGPRPTQQTLLERDTRCAALPRDLTGAFFGDPPVGFSALERRI